MVPRKQKKTMKKKNYLILLLKSVPYFLHTFSIQQATPLFKEAVAGDHHSLARSCINTTIMDVYDLKGYKY